MTDELKIAAAFKAIANAALLINGVLLERDDLNDSVPTNWPLNLSADEFAFECLAMVDHYEAMAEKLNYDRKYGNRV